MGKTYLIGHIIVVLVVCLSTWATRSREECLRNIYYDSINLIRHYNKVNCSGSLEIPLRKNHHRRNITRNGTFGAQHKCILKLSRCPEDPGNNEEMRAINNVRCLLQNSTKSTKECKWKNERPNTLSKPEFLHCWCRFLNANPNT